MKLGLIARADNSGLGMQTLEFYRHMKPDKTMVVDISKYNGNRQYPDRYSGEGVTFITGFPQDADIVKFLTDLDVVFIAEASYNPNLYDVARLLGVKTAVQYNYEFMDWLINPAYPKPDMLVAPSKWHYQDVQAWCDANGVQHTYLHCPVNREALKFREIKQARTFLHVAGRSAAFDRNGTKTVIAATKLFQNDAKILIHFQGEQGLAHQATTNIAEYQQLINETGDPSKVELSQYEFEDYADVYKHGDVLLLPRRYGGNCLPLNEALSVGMPAIMTDISPNNEFLPHAWLVMAGPINRFEPRTIVDIYGAKPEHLAHAIDRFYNMDEARFMLETVRANNIAESISWDNMEWQYRQVLEQLCA